MAQVGEKGRGLLEVVVEVCNFIRSIPSESWDKVTQVLGKGNPQSNEPILQENPDTGPYEGEE
jgi:hypothetical protein